LRAHFPSLLRLSSKLCSAMSSLSGSAAEGEGSGKKTEAPEMAPPASWKRGRPKGSRNKKTLAALAATAATAVTPTAATGVALAPGGEGVPKRRGPGRPRKGGRKDAPTPVAASSPSRRRGRPPVSKNKKTLAALGAAASGSARPRTATSSPSGPSRLQPEKPALQPPAYLSTEGWSTCIVPILAGAQNLLRLPSQFTESMEG
jgi:high mobility group AT-hook protein 2